MFLFFVCSTFVIAAVSVVLPWSMCPIVPMFTCGLLRSNFSFAISLSSPQNLLGYFALRLVHDFVRDAARHFFVLAEVHREGAASLRAGPQLGGIAEHLRQRNHCLNNLGSAQNLGTLETAAARNQIAVHRAH